MYVCINNYKLHGKLVLIKCIIIIFCLFVCLFVCFFLKRAQVGSKNELATDEALLQVLCAINENALGNVKLYVFTEKPDNSG